MSYVDDRFYSDLVASFSDWQRPELEVRDPAVRAFHDNVRMVLDPEIDAAYPERWMGRVTVTVRQGGSFEKRITSASLP